MKPTPKYKPGDTVLVLDYSGSKRLGTVYKVLDPYLDGSGMNFYLIEWLESNGYPEESKYVYVKIEEDSRILMKIEDLEVAKRLYGK